VSFADAAKHGTDGMPANCQLLVNWLASAQNVTKINNSGLLIDVPNQLSGRYLITGTSDQAQGIEGGSDAIGIRNSNLTMKDPTTPLAPNNIQITSQTNADCVNCLPNGGDQYAWATKEWDHPHLGEMPGLAWFQVNLGAGSILGDWSNNPENFVGVDWVLSFPAKYAYLDYVDGASCVGGAGTGTMEWCLLDQTHTGYGIAGIWTGTAASETSVGETGDCLGITDNQLGVWDREEQAADATVTVSPGSRTTLDVCQELQVFTLAPVGTTPRDSIIQTADRRGVITFENLDAIYGWAQMTLSWPIGYADAMSGIIFTTRATEDPVVNNGSITELQKKTSYFNLP
jgi:hypothetical protein